MEVFGQPEKDGKLVADDVSAFKFITLRALCKGCPIHTSGTYYPWLRRKSRVRVSDGKFPPIAGVHYL